MVNLDDKHRPVVDFFERSGMQVRTMGEGRRMSVIWQDKFAIPCYVDEDTIVLLNKQHKGEELARYNVCLDTVPASDMNAHIANMELFKMFRVKLKSVDLFLCGFNFLNRKEKQQKYPVFSQHRVNVYHDAMFAQSIISAYPQFDLEVD